MIRRILVIPQHEAERLDLDDRYAVVSITDPGQKVGIRCQCVLPVQFRDGDGSDTLDAMTRENAERIATFVRELPDTVTTLVVHCYAAAKRSPSIAMAIADGLGLELGTIAWASMNLWQAGHGLDAPNEHCYSMMRQAMPAHENAREG